MKKYLLPLLALAACSAPDSAEQQKQKSGEQPHFTSADVEYKYVHRRAALEQLTQPDVLLGFQLGMSEQAAEARIKKQIQAGKIRMGKLGNSPVGFYDLAVADGTVYPGALLFDFSKGQLAQVSISFFGTSCEKDSIFEQMLIKKFGKPRYSYAELENGWHNVWIQGGREIDQYCLNSSVPLIKYSSVKLTEDKLRTDSLEKVNKSNKSLRDL